MIDVRSADDRFGTERSREPEAGAADRDSGVILVFVLVAVILISMVSIPILSYVRTVFRAQEVQADRAQATELANGGVWVALANEVDLYDDCPTPASDSIASSLEGVTVTCTILDTAPLRPASEMPIEVAVVQANEALPSGGVTASSTYPDTAMSSYPNTPADPSAWLSGRASVPTADTVWFPQLPVKVETSGGSRDTTMPPNSFNTSIGSTCRVFFPGTFDDEIVIDEPAYFTSGVYYFTEPIILRDGAHVVVGNGSEIGCTNDFEAVSLANTVPEPLNMSGLGGTFILGDNARISVEDAGGDDIFFAVNQRFVSSEETSVAASSDVAIIAVSGTHSPFLPNEGLGMPLYLPDVLDVPASTVDTDGDPNAVDAGYLPSRHTPSPSVPEAPEIMSVEALRLGSEGRLALTFTEPENGGSWIRYYEATDSVTGQTCRTMTPIRSGLAPLPACHLTNIPDGTIAQVSVVAVNGLGFSDPSQSVTAPIVRTTTTPLSPEMPATTPTVTNESVSGNYTDGIRVSWTAPAEVAAAPISYSIVTAVDTDSGDEYTCTAWWTETSCIVRFDNALFDFDEYDVTVQSFMVDGDADRVFTAQAPVVTVIEDYNPVGIGTAPADPGPIPAPDRTRASEAILDFTTSTSTRLDVIIDGYVSVPQGHIEFDAHAPGTVDVELSGGVVAGAIDVGTEPGDFEIYFDNPVAQKRIRILSDVEDSGIRADAVVQVNRSGSLAINSWVVGPRNDATSPAPGDPPPPPPGGGEDDPDDVYVDPYAGGGDPSVDYTADYEFTAPDGGDGGGDTDGGSDLGTAIRPFTCLAQIPATADGRYYFDFGSGVFQASVDADEGGGWVNVAQYQHAGGTNWGLDIRTVGEDWPEQIDGVLGSDGAFTTGWGHTGQAAAATIADDSSNLELRWFAQTDAHDRTIHFRSPVLGEFQDNAEPGFLSGGLSGNFTPLSGHDANLPASTAAEFTDQGDLALTNFPFYQSGVAHWGIAGNGSRWEVDDYANGSAQSTLHRVWVRSTSSTGACDGGGGSGGSGGGPALTPCTDSTQWAASYWNNMTLASDPALQGCESQPVFDWSTGPGPTGQSDGFSARWTKTISIPSTADYDITVGGDDGYRLRIDGALVAGLDDWNNGGYRTSTATVNLTAGDHDFEFEYYESTGDARVSFDLVLAPLSCGSSDPWTASYWNNTSWSGDPDHQQCETAINQNWGNGAGPGGNIDNFSGRWTRTFDVPTTADYSFTMNFDDAYWIYVDGVERASELNAFSGVRTEVIELAAGTREITIEMREGGGGARAIASFAPVVTGHPCTDVSQWQASYWNNTDLSGDAGLEECAPDVDINWGSGTGPDGQVDNFSARYVKTIDVPTTGDYQFTIGADDGIRVFIDGVSLYENWTVKGFSTVGVVETLDAGQHEIVVEYYESGGGAQVFFDYAPITCASLGQWQATYWNNQTLSGASALEECASAVDINWGDGGPAGQTQEYSARYEKTIEIPATADYDFTIGADDGIRVFVDGVNIYELWTNKGFSTEAVRYELAAGQREIVVEYYEYFGGARVFFDYVLAPVPTAVLSQNVSDAVVTGDFVSDGTGVGVPDGTGVNMSGAGATTSSVTFTFTVTDPGDYLMSGSVRSPNGNDDSFYVTAPGSPADGWLWDTGVFSTYSPVSVSNRNGNNPQLVTLDAGTHDVTVWLREDGTYIESMEIIRQ